MRIPNLILLKSVKVFLEKTTPKSPTAFKVVLKFWDTRS